MPIIYLKVSCTIGPRKVERRPVNISRAKITDPYLSIEMKVWEYLEGKIPAKIFEPSKGGRGIRLKIARPILRYMLLTKRRY
jgi:hypothetical protein